MSIAITCPECGTPGEAPERAAGREVKCPACGAVVGVPGDKKSNTLLFVLIGTAVALTFACCAGGVGTVAYLRVRAARQMARSAQMEAEYREIDRQYQEDLQRMAEANRKKMDEMTRPADSPPVAANPPAPEAKPSDKLPDKFQLRDDLGSRDPERRRQALKILETTLPYADAVERKDVLDVVAGYATEPDPRTRDAAVAVLLAWGDEGHPAALAEGLRSGNAALKTRVFDALEKLKSPETVPALTKALESPLNRPRAAAVLEALGDVAEPGLIDAAKGAGLRASRLECIRLLGKIGRSPAAEQTLTQLSAGADPSVRRAAKAALTAWHNRK
ncbi:MAG: HEAT repeat domain-containing protein [Gemmataceae bacterium]